MTTEFEKHSTPVHCPQEAKLAWQRPAMERIDIKRTMGGAGSFADTVPGTTALAP